MAKFNSVKDFEQWSEVNGWVLVGYGKEEQAYLTPSGNTIAVRYKRTKSGEVYIEFGGASGWNPIVFPKG